MTEHAESGQCCGMLRGSKREGSEERRGLATFRRTDGGRSKPEKRAKRGSGPWRPLRPGE